MTESTETAHRAWDVQWASEAGRAHWLEPHPDVAAEAARLAATDGARVLDLGCGVGRHALCFARAGLATVAVDASSVGLAKLAEAAAAEGLEIETHNGVMTALPFADGAFDHVLAFNVIYHGAPDVVAQAVAEICRVLKRGGSYHGTMLTKRDSLYGVGEEIAPDTFVASDAGDDKAHPHFYCDAAGLIGLFAGFEALALEDRPDAGAKRAGARHWHFRAERI